MPFDQARTARGAVAGAVAAGLWAAQQPLDKRVFGVDYDDTELLGKTVTDGPAWPPGATSSSAPSSASSSAASTPRPTPRSRPTSTSPRPTATATSRPP